MNGLSMVGGQPQTDFEMWVPLLKSRDLTDENGPIEVEGIITDESPDTDDEIIQAAEAPDAFAYLERGMGRFNYDHKQPITGDIHEFRFMPVEEANRRFAELLKSRGRTSFAGKQVGYVRGLVHPITSEAPDELRQCRHLLKCHREIGTPVGFSLQGNYRSQKQVQMGGRKVTVGVPGFIPIVAITPTPKNSNTICTLVKSLSQLWLSQSEGISGAVQYGIPTLEEPSLIIPQPVVSSPRLFIAKSFTEVGKPEPEITSLPTAGPADSAVSDSVVSDTTISPKDGEAQLETDTPISDEEETGIAKSLDVSGIKAGGESGVGSSTTGGDALKVEDLSPSATANCAGASNTSRGSLPGAKTRRAKSCSQCGSPLPGKAKFCDQCGTLYKSTNALLRELALLGDHLESHKL